MNRHAHTLLFCLLAALPSLAGAAVFNVADGDYAALRQAVRDANGNNEPDTILLAPGGRYRPGGPLQLDTISDNIAIYGGGATIDGEVAEAGRVFTVGENGRLIVADMNIVNVGFSVSQPFFSGGVLNNLGTTVLRNVTIADTTLTVSSGNVLGGAIANGGSLTLANVTLSGNSIQGEGSGSALYNAGGAIIENTTITGNSIGSGGLRAALNATSADSTSLRNSIVAGNADMDCGSMISSAGGNLDSDGSCGLDQSSDISNADPVLGALADNGAGVLTHELQSGSPAIDAGEPSLCTPMDARGVPRTESGSRNTGSRCDMGAHEVWDQGFGFTNGATGSWFDPAQNGHGFMFELLPDGRLLVTWFVFDPAGNRDWVQALGPVTGGIARLTAYQVADGVFPPDFDPEATSLEYWGTLSVIFDRCNAGAVAWMPDVPGYGEGGMGISRITNVAGATCNEG